MTAIELYTAIMKIVNDKTVLESDAQLALEFACRTYQNKLVLENATKK